MSHAMRLVKEWLERDKQPDNAMFAGDCADQLGEALAKDVVEFQSWQTDATTNVKCGKVEDKEYWAGCAFAHESDAEYLASADDPKEPNDDGD